MLQKRVTACWSRGSAKIEYGPITTGEITDIRLWDELYVTSNFCA